MESTHVSNTRKRRIMDNLSDAAILIGFGVQCGVVIAGLAYLKNQAQDLKKAINGLPRVSEKVVALETDHRNLVKYHDELNGDFKEFKDEVGNRVARLETALVKI